MPLDNFQKQVAKIIAPNRTVNSPIAGGSMIQRHAFRLSDDADIFVKDEDVHALFQADKALLESKGLYVEKTKEYDGFIEAIVSASDDDPMGVTNLQWVREGLNGFFPAIKDDEVGFRLHFADLAVNKLLACAGRKEPRDFVDMWMIDQNALPMWRVALAAPGKDIRWSPESIVEKVASNMVFSRHEFEQEVDLLIDLDPAELLRDLTASIEFAREMLPQVNVFAHGRLGVRQGQVVSDRDQVDGTSWIDIAAGGNAELSGMNDDNLIQPIINKYGIDGSRITDSLTFP
ncbi:hypothetical protein KUV57_11150 [Epibacterium sp. DP7N7-1]|nr:hypothetical protein [Epibacterium sp. DP7N7-1]